MGVAHLPFDLGLRDERRDRVDRDDVEGAGAHEQVGDLEPLLAVVGLRDQQLVDVDADTAGVLRVHRVLGVDERCEPAGLLGLRDDVVEQRGLTRALRAEDLDDTSTRKAADTERDVQRQRARRDRVDVRAAWPGSPIRMIEPLPN